MAHSGGAAWGLAAPTLPGLLAGGLRWALRGGGKIAHDVRPPASARAPQVRDRWSTMLMPRPPSEDRDAGAIRGRVGLPPSLTATSIDPSATLQATRSHEPRSGRAWRIELLSSSLITRAASRMAASKMPTASRSSVRRRRATATLAGAAGRSTTLDLLTSLRTRPDATAPRQKNRCERNAPSSPLGNRRRPAECQPTRRGIARDPPLLSLSRYHGPFCGAGAPPAPGSRATGTAPRTSRWSSRRQSAWQTADRPWTGGRMSEPEGCGAAWTEERGTSEPEGRGAAWTEERGTSDEGRRRLIGPPQPTARHTPPSDQPPPPKPPRTRPR